jgi:chaperonin GroEL (HSP60 family)
LSRYVCSTAHQSQVGDGTTSVVIVAAELLKIAEELTKAKIHPTTIISGYRLACKEAVKYIKVWISVSTFCSSLYARTTF